MSNLMQLRQEINKILKGSTTSSSLGQLGDFLQQHKSNALEVVKAFKSLHIESPRSKALNRFDAVFLKRQDEFQEYAAAIIEAGINRILPRGFGQTKTSDQALIEDINYRFMGQQVTFRFNLDANGSKVNPIVSYQPRSSCLTLLAEKVAAAETPAKKTNRFSLKF